jgi:hypothetical protein
VVRNADPHISEKLFDELNPLQRFAVRVVQRYAPPGKGVVRPRRHVENPAHPDVLGEFAFFAVMKAWMDADVIEASVRNAFTHGVDALFLVDNGSTDETVARAEAAGARVAEQVSSDLFDMRMLQMLMNAVVARESLRDGSEHVWWLYLDADEFPEGPGGTTLREYLAGLDRRFRIAGTTCVNHLPTTSPAYISGCGFHPIDFQPVCYRRVVNHGCELPHWKHHLQRFDRKAAFIQCRDGAHFAVCEDESLTVEPAVGTFTHHFQYRDETRTRAMLERLTGPDATRTQLTGAEDYFDVRRRSLDAVYTQHWEDVQVDDAGTTAADYGPAPWPELDAVRRWYEPSEVAAALAVAE